jgi:hypothetical protein
VKRKELQTLSTANVAKAAADEGKMTVNDAKSVVLDGVTVVRGSESISKDFRCIKYHLKKIEWKPKETVVSMVPKVVFPVEQHLDLSPASKNRIDPQLQGVPPGHENLNIDRIKLHSSMTLI